MATLAQREADACANMGVCGADIVEKLFDIGVCVCVCVYTWPYYVCVCVCVSDVWLCVYVCVCVCVRVFVCGRVPTCVGPRAEKRLESALLIFEDIFVTVSLEIF